MAAFGGIALNVAVAEQALLGRFPVAAAKTDDDDVNVRHAAGVAAPRERAVSKADFKPVAIEEKRARAAPPARPG